MTLRRLADRLGIAPSSIVHQLTDRERLVSVLALRTSDAHLAGTEERVLEEGWARADQALGDAVEPAHSRERWVVLGRLRDDLGRATLAAAVAQLVAACAVSRSAATIASGSSAE